LDRRLGHFGRKAQYGKDGVEICNAACRTECAAGSPAIQVAALKKNRRGRVEYFPATSYFGRNDFQQ
jgi:hypothetical protein